MYMRCSLIVRRLRWLYAGGQGGQLVLRLGTSCKHNGQLVAHSSPGVEA